jgi:hypothetical protein
MAGRVAGASFAALADDPEPNGDSVGYRPRIATLDSGRLSSGEILALVVP